MSKLNSLRVRLWRVSLWPGLVLPVAIPFARRSSIVSTGIFSPSVMRQFPQGPRQAATMTIQLAQRLLPFGKGAFKIIMPARERMLAKPKFDYRILAVLYQLPCAVEKLLGGWGRWRMVGRLPPVHRRGLLSRDRQRTVAVEHGGDVRKKT